VEEQGGRVLKTRIKGGTYRLTIEATVLDETPRTLSNGGLVKIQKTLEETLDTPVVLQVDVLAGQYVEVEATPTPTSTIAPTPTSAITPTP
jgi:hypothetical protein